MSLSNKYRVGSFFHSDARAAAFIAIAGALVIVVTAGGALAQPGPQSMELLPNDSAAQVQANQELESFWTPERMKNAIPPPIHPTPGLGSQPAFSDRLPSDATPGYSPGWRPRTRKPDPTLQYEVVPGPGLRGVSPGGVQPQTSPPFSPPGFPTDFDNYAPFQRWTWLGKYVTYPISTIGKLFFTQPGVCANGCVCTGSVISTNTIATAGHCVHNGTNDPNGWSSNILFCPSYNQAGVNPSRGCWAGLFSVTSFQWFNASNFDRDYACIVTATTGTIIANSVGNVTGSTGRAWNFPSKQLEVSYGYPQDAPFDGTIIISTASTEWYEIDIGAGDGQVSKYIGNDQTGGSSGGPWWLNVRAPSGEVADTDGSGITDPAQGNCCPWINGVNSHKRCTAAGCPPGFVFTQEMGSPPFRNTAGDNNESEDVFAVCFSNGG
jgi:V8-like Glu-specific endopeptidase